MRSYIAITWRVTKRVDFAIAMSERVWSFNRSIGSTDDLSGDLFFVLLCARLLYAMISICNYDFSFLLATPSHKNTFPVRYFVPLLTAKKSFKFIDKHWETEMIKWWSCSLVRDFCTQGMQITVWKKQIEPNLWDSQNIDRKGIKSRGCFIFFSVILYNLNVLLYFSNDKNFMRSFNVKGVKENFQTL